MLSNTHSELSKEQMLSTVRLAKSKALVATYLQLTKSLTVQSSQTIGCIHSYRVVNNKAY